jgi:Protein of unknown function (DUF4238)
MVDPRPWVFAQEVLLKPQKTKRPHYVPECYLLAWAEGGNQVAIRRRNSVKVPTPNVANVAVEAGIYGRDEAAQVREKIFGSFEERWPGLRTLLVAQGGTVTGDVRSAISLFAAVQLVRTREHLAQVEFLNNFAKFSSRRPVERDDVRAFLEERHLRFPPSGREVEAAWTFAYVMFNNGGPLTKNEVMRMLFGIAIRELAPRLERYSWTVEHCRKPILFSSDRPVMNWRERSPRDRYEGIGLETADETRMPLTPNDLLVIRNSGAEPAIQQVQPKRFRRVNMDIASQCHEFVIATPSMARDLGLLTLARHGPVTRFDIGPGFREMPDGRREPTGDVLHSWVPVRAD